jgi:hypothetical protein
MNTFHASTFNELEDVAILANFSNLPRLLHDISTFAGYRSQLARVDVISEPRFKGKHGVADLRKSLSALENLLDSIDVDQQPNAGSTVFVVIFRGDIKTFIIDSVESCQLLVTELPGFEIFKLIWPASTGAPLLLTSPASSAYPRTFHLPRSMMDRLLILSSAGTSFFFREVVETQIDPVKARSGLGTATDSSFDRTISRPLAIRPQLSSNETNHRPSLSMSDDLDQLLSIDDEYPENADFSSDSLAAPAAPRPPSAPRPLQSAFDPLYARRSAVPVHQDTVAPDPVALSSEAIFLFMMRQQQDQQEQQARRDEQQARREERRDALQREESIRRDAQMMQMMAAFTAPTRPLAVISTKSDTKLAEQSGISSIRGMFASEARYREFFNVEEENGIPVTNIISAIDALRDIIKLQCLTDPPDLTDANLKSVLFLHFDKGKSGISITDLRPKSMSKVSTPADLTRVLSIASRFYSSVYGSHLRTGFQQLQADLSELLHHLPGSITTPSAIQLVDGALAALRLAFRGFGDLEEVPDASFLAHTASTAMAVPLDHPTVLAFERISIQKALLSQKSSEPSDKPRGDRNAAPIVVPKSATISSS